MSLVKFRGVRLERKKDATLLDVPRRLYAIKRVRIPLYGGPGSKVVPCVKEGDLVQAGQKIADPKEPEGVTVHASLSGKVERISPIALPDSEQCLAVEISGEEDPQPPPQFPEVRKEEKEFLKEDLLAVFRERGLVSMDAKMVPVHARIRNHAPVKTVVINCCEPEPYVTSGQVLVMAHPIEILRGAELLRRAAGAEKAVLVFEDTDREMFELIKSKIYLMRRDALEVRKVPALYPSGSEEILLRNFPENTIVWNATTAYTVYEAVWLGKPLYERIVTVGGECVVAPRNLWLPAGLSFQDAIHACKGFLRDPKKIIAGGPMTGIAQAGLSAPVTMGTNAILALPPEIAGESEEQACIRCNACGEACPVSISPAMITLAAERGEFEEAVEWGCGECIECGVCSYVCPAKRPMLDLIRAARPATRERS